MVGREQSALEVALARALGSHPGGCEPPACVDGSLPGVAHATARHYVTAAGAGEVGMGSPHGTTPTVMLGALSEVQQ